MPSLRVQVTSSVCEKAGDVSEHSGDAVGPATKAVHWPTGGALLGDRGTTWSDSPFHERELPWPARSGLV